MEQEGLLLRYSIITATKNEAKHIRQTIESVISQTLLAEEWIIINDGSTDETTKIIGEYSQIHPFIKNYEIFQFRPDLNAVGGRVASILNLAMSKLGKDVDIIVKLDADVRFDNNFVQDILAEFIKDKNLGVAGGTLVQDGMVEKVDYNSSGVRGAVMFIRGKILEVSGGFFESKGNGEDTLLSVAARYFGWQTKSFPIIFHHLKPEGYHTRVLSRAWQTGFYKGSIPYNNIYFILTLFGHLRKKPYIINSFIQLFGYIYSKYIQKYRPFPEYVAIQLEKEQKKYLRMGLKSMFRPL